MLFKMLGIEQAWDDMVEQSTETLSRPRQLFVTQSRFLAEKVEEYFFKLYNSRAAAKRTTKGLEIRTFPVKREHNMYDLDEEEFWRDTLPKKFTELEDRHFPLFLTYDRVRQA